MILAVGSILLLTYGVWMWAANPTMGFATGGAVFVAIAVLATLVYMTERERGPTIAEGNDDD
ncbi:MAG: hypothetical protein OXI91_07630 [Chloroflexota bacterium]|nr:hypothetical protein [Chloroflexota bacterium]